MGAGAMTEMETLPRPNSAAGGARSREVLVDAALPRLANLAI